MMTANTASIGVISAFSPSRSRSTVPASLSAEATQEFRNRHDVLRLRAFTCRDARHLFSREP